MAANQHVTSNDLESPDSDWQPKQRGAFRPTKSEKTPSTTQYHSLFSAEDAQLKPQDLDSRAQKTQRILRLIFDILVFGVAFLFLVFGFLVYRYDGSPLEPNALASKLLSAATYGPTIYPILFAAVAGGAAKALATWQLQQGTTVGQVEQLLGSSTISSAFITQVQLRAVNLTAFSIILLWALSPVGSQAALRVVYTDSVMNISSFPMKAVNYFTQATMYETIDGTAEATMNVIPFFTALLHTHKLLSTRNQDLWSNIRIPRIANLTAKDDDYSWKSLVNASDIAYASLAGVPVAPLTLDKNQTFTITNTSYTDFQCSRPTVQPFVNYTSSAPSPGGSTDCRWGFVDRGQYSLAFSKACVNTPASNGDMSGTRNPRKFVWQSVNGTPNQRVRVDCTMTTAYVDLEVSCQMSICSPVSIRKTKQATDIKNWTVLDFMSGTMLGNFLNLWHMLFPEAGIAGTKSPIVGYMGTPDSPQTFTGDLHGLSSEDFEVRFMQIFNTLMMLGAAPNLVTSMSASDIDQVDGTQKISFNGQSTVDSPVIRCNRTWLALLSISSIVACLLALGSAGLRLLIRIPDVLGSTALAMLDNKAFHGLTTWNANEKTREIRHVKIQLGDVAQDEPIGRLGVVVPSHPDIVGKIVPDRLYL